MTRAIPTPSEIPTCAWDTVEKNVEMITDSIVPDMREGILEGVVMVSLPSDTCIERWQKDVGEKVRAAFQLSHWDVTYSWRHSMVSWVAFFRYTLSKNVK